MDRALRLAWLPILLGAGPANAHSPVPGIEGFYVGAMHPFSTPSQALLMLGLGLLVGSFPTDKARWLLAAFLVASLGGLVFGPRGAMLDTTAFAMAVMTCALAALVPGRLFLLGVGTACVGGVLIGVLSIPDDGPAHDRLFTMTGSFFGANVGLLYIFGIGLVIRERFTRPWIGIAFRILAAWLGAIALLMLALEFAPVATPS